jgi:hypothetical protein
MTPRSLGWRDLPPVLLLFALAVATGLWGLDFGVHWDERPAHVERVRYLIEQGTWLPDNYNYPSLNQAFGLLALAPELLRSETRSRDALLEVLAGEAYLLRYRALLLVVCSLGVAWVYALLLAWRGSRLEAFAGAGALGLSWELAYHSRFVATDALLAQFGALTALGCVRGLGGDGRSARAWLAFAAVAAGLGCGSKYPGGALLVPVLAAGALRGDARGAPAQVRRAAILAGIFAATYLATTPGTVLRFEEFAAWIGFVTRHYAAASHFGFNVEPGLPHLAKILEYLGTVAFSHFTPIALAFAGLAVIGVAATFRDSWRLGAVLVSFPVVYLAYFSSQGVLIVRNLLVVLPFLAVLAARGFGFACERARRPLLRRTLAAAALAALAGNAVWLAVAAETIASRRDHDRWVAQAAAYVDARPRLAFALSPRLERQLARRGPLPTNAADLGAADRVLFYSREPEGWLAWPANEPRQTRTWFGPFEVNFDYYPVWRGQQRIVVMDRERLPPAFRSLFARH